MIISSCSSIRESESGIFYRFNRELNGYVIIGLFIAPTKEAKTSFIEIWKYFVSEVVRADNIYYAVPLEVQDSILNLTLTFVKVLDGNKIYKVDNSVKDQYSAYSKHLNK